MRFWTFLVIALIVQERVSTDAALFQARHHNFNIWIVHLIWLTATVTTTILGFLLGKGILKKFRNTPVDKTVKAVLKRVKRVLGLHGEKYAFILLGIVNFPFINGILASVVDVPFKILFPLMLLGNTAWYISAWVMNIYIRRHVHNPLFALYVVVASGIILGIVYKKVFNKLTK